MTKVEIFRHKGRPVGFNAKGHTGYAQEGSDIVCSAISVLTTSAVNGLTELLKLNVALETGEAGLYCMLEDGISESDMQRAEIILETMAMGLNSVADTYGDYIKIIEREV
ncbi:MAG: ribosomal-processing cysteine protease Prp [Clostridia bacterium]